MKYLPSSAVPFSCDAMAAYITGNTLHYPNVNVMVISNAVPITYNAMAV